MMIKNDRYFKTLFDEGISSSLEDYYDDMKMNGNLDDKSDDEKSDDEKSGDEKMNENLVTKFEIVDSKMNLMKIDEKCQKIHETKREICDNSEFKKIITVEEVIQTSEPSQKFKTESTSFAPKMTIESGSKSKSDASNDFRCDIKLEKYEVHSVKIEENDGHEVKLDDDSDHQDNSHHQDQNEKSSSKLPKIEDQPSSSSHNTSNLPAFQSIFKPSALSFARKSTSSTVIVQTIPKPIQNPHTLKRERISSSESTDTCDSLINEPSRSSSMLNITFSPSLDDGIPQQKKQTCQLCGKHFSKELYLKQHLRSHRELSHRCATCGKRYETEEELNEHQLKGHMVDKPFKCNYCMKSFCHKSDLNRHLLNHTKGKKFKCDQCSKSFARSDHMLKHELTHEKRLKKQRLK
jgi:uncharacterized Zn-finger protein